MASRYRMVAIDLDGTLVSSAGAISAACAGAIARAREAGVRITICTGRGLVECEHFLRDIAQSDPVAVAGGSIVSCPVQRHTLHRFNMDRGVVERAVQRLLAHGHPVLVLKDPVEAGYDYLVVTGDQDHPLDPVTAWWFREMNVKVRYARSIGEDEHPEHTVRFGICGTDDVLAVVARDLHEACGERTSMHHFPAVVAPEHARSLGDGRRYHILEVFDRGANKWSAIRWIADRHGIAPEHIAAVGDQINDLPMIRGAGLGIAMGNAVESVRSAATRVTTTNDECGVAHAIDHILAGHW